MKKRAQHYVWRYYLKSWSVDDKIFCLRNGRVFESNLMGIGNKRDFYKLNELSKEDGEFIKKVLIEPLPHLLQELNTNWVNLFDTLSRLKSLIPSVGVVDPKLKEAIEEIAINAEEDLHNRIEESGKKYIDSILQKNIGFFDTDEGNLNFVYFLCVQYMRTMKIKSSVLANVRAPQNVDLERAWNVMSHILATNIAWNLYANRANFQMILLDNQSPVRFITGDQPVINTYATGNPKNPLEQLELYYPLSPSIAVLVMKKGSYEGIDRYSISDQEAFAYNEHIARNAHDQIYASSKKALERYICSDIGG